MRRLLICLLCLFFAIDSFALNWWTSPDKEGQRLLKQGQFQQAAKTFARSDWAAVAAYRGKDYTRASSLFLQQQTADGYYNAGNAYAQAGKYTQAIAAYDKALKIDPKHADALYNRKILQNLPKQQQTQKNSTNKDQQQNNQNEKGADSSKQQKAQAPKENTPPPPSQKNQDKKPKSQNQVANKQQQENNAAKERWLNLIPDDPGGLLREKFLRDHIRRQQGWYQ